MNLATLVRELGLPTGLLVGALTYIWFFSVPKKCYEDAVADRSEMTKAIKSLTERVGILLDREGVRTT